MSTVYKNVIFFIFIHIFTYKRLKNVEYLKLKKAVQQICAY